MTDESLDETLRETVETVASRVAEVWPLHSFVTANPLAGFEDRPFRAAVRAGERLFGGRGYPSAAVFRRAHEAGRIDPDRLAARLPDGETPAASLDRMAAVDAEREPGGGGDPTPTDRVDAALTTWLAAFLDEGRADWSMPGRERGFYAAVRGVARHDPAVPDGAFADLAADPADALAAALSEHPRERWESIIEHHLAALPGWTGLIRHRVEAGGDWQAAAPVTLVGYLAVRLALTAAFGAPVDPGETAESATPGGAADRERREAWLSAWEATYRAELVAAVADEARALDDGDTDGTADSGVDDGDDGDLQRATDGDDPRRATADDPAAQLVFCIDTRSEVIRRHVEAAGPYETWGYAGFFGVPVRYDGYDTAGTVDACPPIVDAAHRVTERPRRDRAAARDAYDRWAGLRSATRELLHTLRTNPGTAFSFVESAGGGYGLALAARTLLPTRASAVVDAVRDRVPDVHEFVEPALEAGAGGDGDHDHADGDDRDHADGDDHDNADGDHLPHGLTLADRVSYAEAAFELTGWEAFARLVVFVGHASTTANNAFDASLDCGACAGNPGGPNARLLAAICNDEAVRAALRERGHEIPADTVFVAGEHDTTTDEITLYDGAVPESHADDLDRLRADLRTARRGAATERVGDDPAASRRETARRAADWAEPRPEWGLAGNAAFVIGPRALTAGLNLDGRAFLHSYDPATDPDGEALAAILTGPGVVTQWINAQYYFATVDPAVYGSGSKVTHNPVGNVGVYQGNGGDLATGLPAQSVRVTDDEPYHQPLRLSVVVYAPRERVREILAAHDHLRGLFDGGWLSLTVVDPADGRPVHYDGDGAWSAVGGDGAAAPRGAPDPEPADD